MFRKFRAASYIVARSGNYEWTSDTYQRYHRLYNEAHDVARLDDESVDDADNWGFADAAGEDTSHYSQMYPEEV